MLEIIYPKATLKTYAWTHWNAEGTTFVVDTGKYIPLCIGNTFLSEKCSAS